MTATIRNQALALGLALCAAGMLGGSAEASHHRHKAPGSSVRAATARANHSPGVTKDIAPDSKQSATGGQPGGVPGAQ